MSLKWSSSAGLLFLQQRFRPGISRKGDPQQRYTLYLGGSLTCLYFLFLSKAGVLGVTEHYGQGGGGEYPLPPHNGLALLCVELLDLLSAVICIGFNDVVKA